MHTIPNVRTKHVAGSKIYRTVVLIDPITLQFCYLRRHLRQQGKNDEFYLLSIRDLFLAKSPFHVESLLKLKDLNCTQRANENDGDEIEPIEAREILHPVPNPQSAL
ncbi:hypothetical protein CEXT_636281 [Caerostris extrusa]|uniref:Uncharacterized protein n=1 Tax=Caerostris extrusa TaxID=172846 RepID=A0AAV4RKX0_CAEEX|nr:hypothetical protein CEXT_636281 [Caerostris extrusa]